MACGFWYTSHMKQLFHLNQLRTTLQKTDLFKRLFINNSAEPKEERRLQCLADDLSLVDAGFQVTDYDYRLKT